MALNRLPEPNRQALTMYYLGESSIKEVGRALGTSSQAAKMRIHRARKQLQKETLNMVTDTLKRQAHSPDFKERFQVSDITIFFSDITGFAGVTTDYPPEVWIDALYEYMSEMADILFQYEGVLDNYEGDSIMGIFGAPKAYDDHAVKGCRHAPCLPELGTVFTNHHSPPTKCSHRVRRPHAITQPRRAR